jgi:hypothetical protein
MYKITTPIFLGLSTLIKLYITLSNAASKPILYYKSRFKNCKHARSLIYKLIHTDRQGICSSLIAIPLGRWSRNVYLHAILDFIRCKKCSKNAYKILGETKGNMRKLFFIVVLCILITFKILFTNKCTLYETYRMLKLIIKTSLYSLLHVSAHPDHPQGAYAEPC